jgi:hypothetical protein
VIGSIEQPSVSTPAEGMPDRAVIEVIGVVIVLLFLVIRRFL